MKTINRGDYIILSIEDSGVGIQDNIKDRVFDPFFTTKENGTGIGLSIVKGIIESKNGRIEIGKSELGGTKIEVYIKK
ncbi:MAG: ATP-binding protein [Candidatus Hydrogenedentota bacterium]